MPNMMESMASGSQAALQMQRNYAAAPYVQQEAAAVAQKQQLDIQQEQGNIERTKIANLVSNTDIKNTEEKKSLVKSFYGDPANKDLSQSDLASRLSAAFSANGYVEDAQKLSKQAVDVELKQALVDSKKNEADIKVLGTAHANLAGATEEQAKAIIKNFEDDPVQNKAITSKSPTFFKMEPAQQKAVLEELIMSSTSQGIQQRIAGNIRIQEMKMERAKEHDEFVAREKQWAKEHAVDKTNTKQNQSDRNTYFREDARINRAYEDKLDEADAAVVAAQANVDMSSGKASARKLIGFTVGEKDLEKYNKAVAARSKIQRQKIEDKSAVVSLFEDGDLKNKFYDKINNELAAFQEEPTPKAKPTDKAATPAASAAQPGAATTSAKDVTSSKAGDGSSKESPLPQPSSKKDVVPGNWYMTPSGPQQAPGGKAKAVDTPVESKAAAKSSELSWTEQQEVYRKEREAKVAKREADKVKEIADAAEEERKSAEERKKISDSMRLQKSMTGGGVETPARKAQAAQDLLDQTKRAKESEEKAKRAQDKADEDNRNKVLAEKARVAKIKAEMDEEERKRIEMAKKLSEGMGRKGSTIKYSGMGV